MLIKVCFATLLLICSMNADILHVMNTQNELNNSDEGSINNNGISSNQLSVPQFNSLAEAEANRERIINEKIIPYIHKMEELRASFAEKYLIKNTDTLNMIDEKYKNRVQLSKDMQQDFIVYVNDVHNLSEIADHFDLGKRNITVPSYELISSNPKLDRIESFLNENGYVAYPTIYALEDALMAMIDCDPKEAHDSDAGCDLNYSYYEEYLKEVYARYNVRQKYVLEAKERRIGHEEWEQKQIQAKKEEPIRLANEQKERKKVQGVCKAWIVKANRMVYSLGIGDPILYYWMLGDMKGSAIGVIRGVNTNTFLIVDSLGHNRYVAKSSSIAYEALKTVPSPYCYK